MPQREPPPPYLSPASRKRLWKRLARYGIYGTAALFAALVGLGAGRLHAMDKALWAAEQSAGKGAVYGNATGDSASGLPGFMGAASAGLVSGGVLGALAHKWRTRYGSAAAHLASLQGQPIDAEAEIERLRGELLSETHGRLGLVGRHREAAEQIKLAMNEVQAATAEIKRLRSDQSAPGESPGHRDTRMHSHLQGQQSVATAYREHSEMETRALRNLENRRARGTEHTADRRSRSPLASSRSVAGGEPVRRLMLDAVPSPAPSPEQTGTAERGHESCGSFSAGDGKGGPVPDSSRDEKRKRPLPSSSRASASAAPPVQCDRGGGYARSPTKSTGNLPPVVATLRK
jgi:hypothetical protein